MGGNFSSFTRRLSGKKSLEKNSIDLIILMSFISGGHSALISSIYYHDRGEIFLGILSSTTSSNELHRH